jgi:hypothetical protein
MATDLFEQLAEAPVPAPPPSFDSGWRQRLNRRLLAGQLLDLAVRGFGSAMWHLARAGVGLVILTLTGKFEPRASDGQRPAP